MNKLRCKARKYTQAETDKELGRRPSIEQGQ